MKTKPTVNRLRVDTSLGDGSIHDAKATLTLHYDTLTEKEALRILRVLCDAIEKLEFDD